MSRPVTRIADLARGRLIGVLLDAAPPTTEADPGDGDRIRLLVALLLGGLEDGGEVEFDPGGRAFACTLALAGGWQRRGLPLDRACAAFAALRQAAWDLLLERLRSESDRGLGLLRRLDRRVDGLLLAVVAGYDAEPERERGGIFDLETGAVTREFFDQVLTGEVERGRRYGRPFAVLVIALAPAAATACDGLAGAEASPRRRLGSALNMVSRHVDTVGCRGADRFTILMPETAAEEGWVLAGRVRTLLEAAETRVADVSSEQVRIGLISYPQDAQTVNGIFKALHEVQLQAPRDLAGWPRLGRGPDPATGAGDELGGEGAAESGSFSADQATLAMAEPDSGQVAADPRAERHRLRDEVVALRLQQDDLRRRLSKVARQLDESGPGAG